MCVCVYTFNVYSRFFVFAMLIYLTYTACEYRGFFSDCTLLVYFTFVYTVNSYYKVKCCVFPKNMIALLYETILSSVTYSSILYNTRNMIPTFF